MDDVVGSDYAEAGGMIPMWATRDKSGRTLGMNVILASLICLPIIVTMASLVILSYPDDTALWLYFITMTVLVVLAIPSGIVLHVCILRRYPVTRIY